MTISSLKLQLNSSLNQQIILIGDLVHLKRVQRAQGTRTWRPCAPVYTPGLCHLFNGVLWNESNMELSEINRDEQVISIANLVYSS